MSMRAFAYKGKTTNGRFVQGTIEASNEVEARVKLRAQRIIPLRVIEGGVMAASSKGGGLNLLSFLTPEPKISSKELQIFTRQFSTMINAGLPIVQALDILGGQTPIPAFRKVLKEVKTRVEGGRRLAESLDGFPKIFSRLYVSMVKSGEEAGALDVILNRLATYIEKAVRIKNQVVGALWYPVGILTVAMGVVILLLTFVIPKFETIFKSSNQQLPAPTQFVINASHFMQEHFVIVIVGIFLSIFGLIKYYGTKVGRRRLDRILLETPLFGSLIQKTALARFSRTMSTMLGCGVGIIDALDVSSNVVGNVMIEEIILRARAAISEGKSIVQPLSKEHYIPSMVVQMIGVGEATGKLDSMLSKIADFYEEEVDHAVAAMTKLMEPIMMVFLGGIIGGLVIAMYLPIFNMAGAVK